MTTNESDFLVEEEEDEIPAPVSYDITKAHYDRLKGRIKIGLITDEYLPRFGPKYVLRFKKDLNITTANFLSRNRRDIKNSYSNIITWRNEFAHQGGINRNVTFNEVVTAYEDGEEVLHCLGRALHG